MPLYCQAHLVTFVRQLCEFDRTDHRNWHPEDRVREESLVRSVLFLSVLVGGRHHKLTHTAHVFHCRIPNLYTVCFVKGHADVLQQCFAIDE